METKKGRFFPEIRVFLSELIRDPLLATPSQYLKERGLNRSKLINLLLKHGIIERGENVTEDKENGKPVYTVKYSVPRKNFNKKLSRLYTRLFEKNLPQKKEEKSIDECGDCASVGGAFVAPLNTTPIRRTMIVNEEQFKLINDVINEVTKGDIEEATTTTTIGALGDYTAPGIVLKTSDGKKDPSYDR